MTDLKNPLMVRAASPINRKPFITVERTGEQVPTDIDGYCAWLNSLNWVQASGRPYLAGKDTDGRKAIIRYGERTDA